MAEPMRGDRAERFAGLLVRSVVITTVGGMLLGAAGFTVVSSGPFRGWRDVLLLPVTMLLSIPFTLPFGVVCGTLAAGVLELLLRSSFRMASRRLWIAVGGAVGLTLGALCPLFLHAIGFNAVDPISLALFGGLGASAGACCGLLLGWLGWIEARRHLGPPRVPTDE